MKALVATAPCVSETLYQYRTKQQLTAAHVVTLVIAAALTADAMFHGIGQRLGGCAAQLGKSLELADNLLRIARVHHGVVSAVDDQRRHKPHLAR